MESRAGNSASHFGEYAASEQALIAEGESAGKGTTTITYPDGRPSDKLSSEMRLIMKKEIFNQLDVDNGLNLIVISYFDRMYEDGNFIRSIQLISQKNALNTDGAYCHFSNINNFDDKKTIEGVEFSMGYPPTDEDTVTVSEKTCYKYVRLACKKYLALHPEDTDKVNELLAKMPM